MEKTGRRIPAPVGALEEIEDFLLAFVVTKDARVCPICKRSVEEWGEDFLPTPFETCAPCWPVFRGYDDDNNHKKEKQP